MPQAWPTPMPRAWNHSIIARGAAEPPIVTCRRAPSSAPVASTWPIVALGPSEVVGLAGDQRLEAVLAGRGVEADIMLDRRPLRLQPLDRRREGAVVEQHPVAGMVGDVDELLVEQARVDRVDDSADA